MREDDGGGAGGEVLSLLLDQPYRREAWAAPTGEGRQTQSPQGPVRRRLRPHFVNQKLFPYLHGFKQKASGPNTIEYKIGEIFGEIKNKINSGYNLREIIDQIDELRFRSQTEKYVILTPSPSSWQSRSFTCSFAYSFISILLVRGNYLACRSSHCGRP